MPRKDEQGEGTQGALVKAGSTLIRMLMLNRHGVPDASKPTEAEFIAALDAWEAALALCAVKGAE